MIIHTFHPANGLTRLISLRWIAILALLLALLLTSFWLEVNLPVNLMLPALMAFLLANILAQNQLKTHPKITDSHLVSHLLTDILVLGWLLYCAGGASNPFASLLLLPLTIAAVALPLSWASAISLMAVSVYSILVFFNIPLPAPKGGLKLLDEVLAESCSIGGAHGSENGPGSGFALHIAGMWLNFLVSAIIMTYYLARQALTLKQNELALREFRERSLREEKVLAMGLMSAGAAHKLGTPLSTLSVMIGEMDDQTPLSADEINLMRQQIQRCKTILIDIVKSADQPNRPAIKVTDWIDEWVDEWHLLRPSILRPRLVLQSSVDQTEPSIAPDQSLNQALQSLLDNAADAAAENTSISCEERRLVIEIYWDVSDLQINILDRGLGIHEDAAGLLGMHFVSTKQPSNQNANSQQVGGLGIGFFLTNASIERFGGKVELFTRELSKSSSGTRTQVRLPLIKLNEGIYPQCQP